MKKTKLLIGTVALSAALMGTGYAYWTQNLQAVATVKTASFNVKYEQVSDTDRTNEVYTQTGAKMYDGPVASGLPANQKEAAGLITSDKAKMTAENGKLTFTIANMFPDTGVIVHAKVKNESTIPVYGIPQAAEFTGFDDGVEGKFTCTVYSENPEKLTNAAKYDKDNLITLGVNESKEVWFKINMTADNTTQDGKNQNVDIKGAAITEEIQWHQFNELKPQESSVTETPTAEPAP